MCIRRQQPAIVAWSYLGQNGLLMLESGLERAGVVATSLQTLPLLRCSASSQHYIQVSFLNAIGLLFEPRLQHLLQGQAMFSCSVSLVLLLMSCHHSWSEEGQIFWSYLGPIKSAKQSLEHRETTEVTHQRDPNEIPRTTQH